MRVVAHPALGRPEDARVLHPVGGKDLRLARVQMDRDRDEDGMLGIAEPFGRARVDGGGRECLLELRDRRPPERRIPFERHGVDRDVRSLGHGWERTELGPALC